jgi:diaminopimelate decarboxylase
MTTPNSWNTVPYAELHALADTYGTPYYLYDADVVNDRIRRVRDALQGAAGIYYAVKANPNLGLLKAVRGTADGLDISSAGELEQALLAGFDPATMSFAGPAKTPAELDAAIRAGVGAISVESTRELGDCIASAQRNGRRARILLRVNPALLNRAYGIKMGGRSVQFGIDEEELPAAEQTVAANREFLDFRGLHVYAGSQCFEPAGVVDGTRNILRIAREVEARSGLICGKINLGGGFGVSQADDGRELDIAALAAELVPVLREFHASRATPCELIFELGRYLTSVAGLYVTRVVSSTVSRGKRYFVCDGGLHHHLAAAGTFGSALRGNFPLRNLTHPDAAPVRCQIAGPSCNPTDLLGLDVDLAQPLEGDLLGVLKSGSYGLTASPLLFLGRPTPVELVRHRGSVSVGRRSYRAVEFN